MDIQDRVTEAQRFFRMWGNRAILLPQAEMKNRGKSNQSFIEGQTRFLIKPGSMKMESWLYGRMDKADQGVEIFYSPTPMKGTKGRLKTQALPNCVIYGDADEGITPEAKAKLTDLGACLVRSGGTTQQGQPKYHVYLVLDSDASPNEVERLNRGLRHLIKGDKYDITSLLRIPGTRNHKYPGAPYVKVERFASKRHSPVSLAKHLPIPEGEVVIDGVELAGMVMPSVPKDFDPRSNKRGYAKLRNTVRVWNQRFNSGDASMRRYKAAGAIVGDSLSRGLSIDEAYAFALTCEPLVDKQEEENGYSIRKDIAKTWYRHTKTAPPSQASSGTLTVEKLQAQASAAPPIHEPAAEQRTTPLSAPDSPTSSLRTETSETLASFSNGLELSEDFGFIVPNLDELLAGEYTPLEPTLVPCGTFALLYPGKSHSLVADRGIGKTHIAIAMVHAILRAGGKVAYFDFEDTPDTFIRDRMMNQHGIPAQMIKTQFLYLGGTAAEIGGMEPDQAVMYLAEKLGDAQWDLVIIDGVSASMGDIDGEWDDNKAVDYKKWHALMVQPFLDQNLATLQLDHSTKSGPRAGGTMQKGAKLTGVEYQVRVHGPNGFTIGRTGQVIIEAVKDRVGRISKHRRSTQPTDHAGKDEWPWNDVATFTLASDDDGHITKALFEPINYKDSTGDDQSNPYSSAKPAISDKEFRVLKALREHGKPMSKNGLVTLTQMGKQPGLALISQMVSKGLLAETDGARKGSKEISIVSSLDVDNLVSAPDDTEPIGDGNGTNLDFSKVKDRPNAGPKRECSKCGEMEYLIKPDEIGYQPGRALCRPCASENIESETSRTRNPPRRR